MELKGRVEQYGSLFGDWHIQKPIGEGSNGNTQVYQMIKRYDEYTEVSALKVIGITEEKGKLEELDASQRREYEEYKKRRRTDATNEIKAMNRLNGHTNIVTYRDSCFRDWQTEREYGCDLLIHMELLKTLEDKLKEEKEYRESEVIRMGRDIATALTVCEREKIIHRDIKPANIFLDEHGNYKLGDFGISKILSGTRITSTSKGTEAYAAPEQFHNVSLEVYDSRVDIYSLGLVLYMWSNQKCLPFSDSALYINERSISKRLCGEPLPPPVQASERLQKLILKACAYYPEERYQNASQLLEAFQSLESNPLIRGNSSVRIKKEKALEPSDPYETKDAMGSFENRTRTVSKERKKAAEKQYNLGLLYLFGDETEQDIKKAAECFQRAAQMGDADAQNNLGYCYAQGIGVRRNDQEAVRWYRTASQNSKEAQYNLGLMYEQGRGVQRDEKEAERWYKKAAENGEVNAQYNLARMYEMGSAVILKQEETAAWWYQKAAEQNHASAQNNLGLMYAQGRGVEQNDKKAVEWYQKAAEKGNVSAQFNLGLMYENMRGVSKDYTILEVRNMAENWYRRAANQGDLDAKERLRLLGEY